MRRCWFSLRFPSGLVVLKRIKHIGSITTKTNAERQESLKHAPGSLIRMKG